MKKKQQEKAQAAYELLLDKKYADAISILNELIEKKSKQAFLLVNRGYAHFHLEQYEQAVEDAKAAFELDKKIPEPRNLGHFSYYKMANYEMQVNVFLQTAHLFYYNFPGLTTMAFAMSSLEEKSKQIIEFVRAQKLEVTAINPQEWFSERKMLNNNYLRMAAIPARGIFDIEILDECKEEQAFEEALTFINKELADGFADANSGFEINFRSNKKKWFPLKRNRKFDPEELPKVPIHNFFAQIIEYPSLHKKVVQYFNLALRSFDWLLDLNNSEENCVPGTFAIVGLVLADKKYLSLLHQYNEAVDDEHQYIQDYINDSIANYYAKKDVAPKLSKEWFSAIKKGNLENIQNLLTANPALIDTPKAKSLNTPLMHALDKGKTEVAQFLIEAGTDIHARNLKQLNALFFAYRLIKKDSTLFDHLIDLGIDVNNIYEDEYRKKTLFALVLKGRRNEAAQLMLDNGADLYLESYYEEIPLDTALNIESNEMASLIAQKMGKEGLLKWPKYIKTKKRAEEFYQKNGKWYDDIKKEEGDTTLSLQDYLTYRKYPVNFRRKIAAICEEEFIEEEVRVAEDSDLAVVFNKYLKALKSIHPEFPVEVDEGIKEEKLKIDHWPQVLNDLLKIQNGNDNKSFLFGFEMFSFERLLWALGNRENLYPSDKMGIRFLDELIKNKEIKWAPIASENAFGDEYIALDWSEEGKPPKVVYKQYKLINWAPAAETEEGMIYNYNFINYTIADSLEAFFDLLIQRIEGKKYVHKIEGIEHELSMAENESFPYTLYKEQLSAEELAAFNEKKESYEKLPATIYKNKTIGLEFQLPKGFRLHSNEKYYTVKVIWKAKKFEYIDESETPIGHWSKETKKDTQEIAITVSRDEYTLKEFKRRQEASKSNKSFFASYSSWGDLDVYLSDFYVRIYFARGTKAAQKKFFNSIKFDQIAGDLGIDFG